MRNREVSSLGFGRDGFKFSVAVSTQSFIPEGCDPVFSVNDLLMEMEEQIISKEASFTTMPHEKSSDRFKYFREIPTIRFLELLSQLWNYRVMSPDELKNYISKIMINPNNEPKSDEVYWKEQHISLNVITKDFYLKTPIINEYIIESILGDYVTKITNTKYMSDDKEEQEKQDVELLKEQLLQKIHKTRNIIWPNSITPPLPIVIFNASSTLLQ